MRRAARIDNNHKNVVKFFRDCGATVLPTHTLGKGAPDIIVGYCGVNCLVEIKDGDKPPSARQLTPDEERFSMGWKGLYRIVNNFADAEKVLNEMASRS